jgi:hypothetical protein
MSKSQNIKRAKMLRQRKKEREKQPLSNENVLKDIEMLREKAKMNNAKIVNRALLGRNEKISSVLLEMIQPILYTAQDEEDAKGIVAMGVVAWNCGIIKKNIGDEKLNEFMKVFKGKKNSIERQLLEEYIQIKCIKFEKYNEFIADYKISFGRDGSMNFSVLIGVSDYNP